MLLDVAHFPQLNIVHLIQISNQNIAINQNLTQI